MNAAFAIICWKNKILLFLRDNDPLIPAPNTWTLPEGRIETGESPIQAVRRELVEEVSYVPKDLHFMGKIKYEGDYTYLYYSFVDEVEAEKFKKGRFEGQRIGFFTLAEMEKIQLAHEVKVRLAKHKKFLKKALKERSFANFNL